MKLERIQWEGWDALRCLTRDGELIVGVSAGPRILSLRHAGGPNLLYRDITDLRVGEWRMHGGHRFTVAPESAASYTPDNDPCSVETHGEELHVIAPTGANGTQRTLVIEAARDGSGFDLRHTLDNLGDRPWSGALWAITCIPHTGSVVASISEPRPRFWPGADSRQWLLTPNHIVMQTNKTRGKAGWHSTEGWLASVRRNSTFVIHCPNPPAAHECVDEGCNLEVFTCADYIELETLSGKITLAPAERASHLQRWRLLEHSFAPHDYHSIGEQAGCSAKPKTIHYAS